MGKFERWGLLLAGALLTAIIVVTLTDTAAGHSQPVRKISVIVDDADAACWKNFRAGAEKAAVEKNIDLSFNTLAEKGNVLQQKQAAEREIENGAEALIISAADTMLMESYFDQLSDEVTVITIGSKVNETIRNIGINAADAGKLLAEEICTSYENEECFVAVFSYTGTKTSHEDMYGGMQAIFDAAGIRSEYVHGDTSTYMESFLQSRGYRNDGVNIVVCLDSQSAETAVDASWNGLEVKIYGAGYNDTTLYFLENEMLEGLIVHNTYVEGYLSVMNAAGVLDKEWKDEGTEPEFFILYPQDIYKEEYQQFLFPI